MSEVAALLAAFHEATGREAAIWERREGAVVPSLLGASTPGFGARTGPGASAWDASAWARANDLSVQLVATGDSVGWLFTELVRRDARLDATREPRSEAREAETADRLVARVVALVRRLARERDGATTELADRYEEINLLYAIGELLGGTATVESVADTLLRELAITVGASRAVFLLTQRTSSSTGTLAPIATLGLRDLEYPIVSLNDPQHIAARVFRSGNACTEEGPSAALSDPLLVQHDGSLLAVAISRPSTGVGITGQFQAVVPRRGVTLLDHVTVPLGVLVLSGRINGTPFTAGDRKLATAVGTQIGIALHNASLVRSAMERQQLERELRLAHDLQLKLLPNPRVVAPEARAAARVVPAESVGGDFYLLARLDANRTAVLIGDVSGHGYQAALVMALSLSAAAIHVQAAFDPAIALEAVRRSLADELSSTDMSLSLCYALIDARDMQLRYANAGHPHAFRLGADGQATRLGATVAPLGFTDEPIVDCSMPWRTGDRLVLFTDGVVDARDDQDRRLGEEAVLEVLAATGPDHTPSHVLDMLFERVDQHARGTSLRDDLAVVVVDRPC
ncbi:MAG TPA: PP2C family protein-serine/threonine phosphatase [Gemmatimonas sp.]|nr:PP2C family protein-serine/threonine phosphatase [Gemmatimonas sp.]